MIEDTELLRRFAAEKSEAAFAELVERRVGLVYSVARRHVGDTQRAEDVTQVVFTSLARKAAELSRRAALVGWLYRAAQFAATDAVRAESRRLGREQEAYTMQELAHAAPEPDWEKLRPVLDEVLNDLDERDRDAVLLRFFDDRPFATIGAQLRMSENAARMRVERGLEKLRSKLASRGVTSTTGALAVALANQVGVAAPAGLASMVTGGALAAAGSAAVGAAAGGAGILTFMSTIKTTVGIAIVAAAVGFGVYETKLRTEAEARVVTAREDLASLQTQLEATRRSGAKSEQRAVRAEEQLTALEKKTRGLFGSEITPAGTLSMANNTAPALGGAFFLSASPTPASAEERRQQQRNLSRPDVRQYYQSFFRNMGFSSEQSERFTELMLDNEERTEKLFQNAAAKTSTKDRESMQLVRDVVREQGQADQIALVRGEFGEPVGDAFARYQETAAVRTVANGLALALFYTDSPLTEKQAERLVEIMGKNARTAAGKVNPGAINKEATLAAAQAVLSARQLEAFSSQIDQAKLRSVSGTLRYR